MNYFNEKEYDEEFKSVDIDLNIMDKILEKFNVPPRMLRYIYYRVTNLKSDGTNIYKCMNIVENELIKRDYEINKLIRESMK